MKIKPFDKPQGVREGSGVTRVGNELLIVTDADPGSYYTFPLKSGAGPLLELRPDLLQRHPLGGGKNGNELALDLEGIDALADGRVVALSERLRCLVDGDGLVIQYDDPFSELGDRGLEGLAIKHNADGVSEIAVLWEGGRIEDDDLQPQIRGLVNPEGRKTAFQPRLLVHRLDANARGLKVKLDTDDEVVALKVPLPDAASEGWRFRAPDLLWLGDEFLVLLNSQAVAEQPGKPKYGPRWLQRFDRQGNPVGQGLNIDDHVKQALAGNPRLKDVIDANWEGLGWFDVDRRVVLVQDIQKDGEAAPLALVLNLPPEWFTAM